MNEKKQKRRRIRTIILAVEVCCLALLSVLIVAVVIRGGKQSEETTRTESSDLTQEESSKSSQNYHANSSKKNTKIENPTEEDVEAYWENSAFFGDSIMKGFGAFLGSEAKGELGSPTVTALVGYDLDNALKPVTAADHPIYNGEKHTIFEVLPMENPEKVVLSFGINDLGKNSVAQIVTNYDTAIQKIREICPDADIYVVSCTYVYSGRESGNRTNANIRNLNSLMQEYCEASDVGFIDVASYMAADDGSLYSGYTADFYVHLNNNAYRTWLQVFRRYAYEALSGREAPEEMFPITKPAPVEKPAYVPPYTMDSETVTLPEATSSVSEETQIPDAGETESQTESQPPSSVAPPSSSAEPESANAPEAEENKQEEPVEADSSH